jgi:glycosyltransferase involved in cell wall biosynthesis
LYTLVPAVPADAPLVFLGRLEAIKGVHHAVAIASEARRRLIIAGNRVGTPSGNQYFEREIRPHLDRERVTYVGEVDDAQKDSLLGGAAALLMPIEWDEPFGIVMIEALACGTPVIGLSRGSVPEVVEDGVTGFVVDDVDGMVAAIGRIGDIDRRRCRESVERRFDVSRMVDDYEASYEQTIESALAAR